VSLRLKGPELDAAIYGRKVLLGVIDATTTSKTNAQATSSFPSSGDLTGKLLLIQADAAVHVLEVNSSTGTVGSSGSNRGVKLATDQLFYVNMTRDYGYLAAVTPSGTANVYIYELV
jgi:hypothetical protein